MTSREGLQAIARAQQEAAVARREQQDDEQPTPLPMWPRLDEAAYHGLPGRIVRAIEPHTEADSAGLLAQLLVTVGSVIGRGPHIRVEADEHHANLFVLAVGPTSKARKGSGLGRVLRLLREVDETWLRNGPPGGLASGEGLIWAVRDPVEKQEPIREHGRITGYQQQQADVGVSDKRLLVAETEFASALRVMGRDGSTLSATIRQAWDSGNLRTMPKNNPAVATGAHISIIGHITTEELRREIRSSDVANGFLNRFLVFLVRRSKLLPEGGSVDPEVLGPLQVQLLDAVLGAREVGEVPRDSAARALWAEVYEGLSEGKPGLLGAVTGRAEAQVVRLSLLYALLDRSTVVRKTHLQAALAVWDYAEASARFIFGDSLGNPVADELWRALQAVEPEGLTRAAIGDHFQRNRSRQEINDAVRLLVEQGRIERYQVETGGRPAELWVTRKARNGAKG